MKHAQSTPLAYSRFSWRPELRNPLGRAGGAEIGHRSRADLPLSQGVYLPYVEMRPSTPWHGSLQSAAASVI
jgi:hypothetical protein